VDCFLWLELAEGDEVKRLTGCLGDVQEYQTTVVSSVGRHDATYYVRGPADRLQRPSQQRCQGVSTRPQCDEDVICKWC